MKYFILSIILCLTFLLCACGGAAQTTTETNSQNTTEALSATGDVSTTPDGETPDVSGVGYPVKKFVAGASSLSGETLLRDFASVRWDGNGDGVADALHIQYSGSGRSFETLYFVDGATGSRTVLRTAVCTFMSIGFEEGDDGAPYLFSFLDAYFPEGRSYAVCAPFARLKAAKDVPEIVDIPLYGEKDRELGNYTDRGKEPVVQKILSDGRTYEPISDEALASLSGFYAEIEFREKRIDEDERYTYTESSYSTLHGDYAKYLYRLLCSKIVSSEEQKHEVLWADRNYVIVNFFTENGGKYRFCGYFSVQEGAGSTGIGANFGEIYEEHRGFTATNQALGTIYEEIRYECQSLRRSEEESAQMKRAEQAGELPAEFEKIVGGNLLHGASVSQDKRGFVSCSLETERDCSKGSVTFTVYEMNGDLRFEKTHELPSGWYVTATPLLTEDGGLLYYVGWSDQYNYIKKNYAHHFGVESYVCKTDKEGEIEWTTPVRSHGLYNAFLVEKDDAYYLLSCEEYAESQTLTHVCCEKLSKSGQLLKTKTFDGSGTQSILSAVATERGFELCIHAWNTIDGDYEGLAHDGYVLFTVNNEFEIEGRQPCKSKGWALGILDGKTVFFSDERFKDNEAGTPELVIDYGDRYLVVSNHATGEKYTPPYVSSIWYYTETVYSCYDKNGTLLWRRGVDNE